jgi:hypothetical protein
MFAAFKKNWIALVFACVAAYLPTGAEASCANAAWWSATTPPINLLHIFCGELDHGTPKGFHSTQLQATSTVVTGVTNQNPASPAPAQIYTATVTFVNGSTKLSTFFPNQCTQQQIETSVLYAYNNQTGPASPWGVLGPSAPGIGTLGYCLTTAGAPFPIRMGLITSGSVRINTAFPQ